MVDDAPEITVLQLPKFKAEATELIGTDGIDAVAVYLIDHPDTGDVIPAADRGREERTTSNRGSSERSAVNAKESGCEEDNPWNGPDRGNETGPGSPAR